MRDSNELERPASWRETLLVLGPLLLFLAPFLLGPILALLIDDLPDANPNLGLGITFAVIGPYLVVLTVGLVKSFPRWVFPYWGLAILITLYMYGFTGTINGKDVTGGLWVWLPLSGVTETLSWTGRWGATLMVILAAPMLIGALTWADRRMRRSSSWRLRDREKSDSVRD